jgi:DEAD/DEAH box helicase domain-containing protein
MDKRSISKLDLVLDSWTSNPAISGNIQYIHKQKASKGFMLPLPEELSMDFSKGLNRSGIFELYGHQVDSFNMVKDGNNVVITTGTASGKSLCYNLPVIDHLIKVPESRALYLFPTKALTQDQNEKLVQLTSYIGLGSTQQINPSIYDGDTPVHKRQEIRQISRCLLTNPDMLHMGILPHHTLWESFFRGLEFVIIDEIHTYRGIFGSNVANVIRRLKRVARFYGSKPVFILTSATIANPVEHGASIIGEELMFINQDDAPHGQKTTILFNPPIIHKETGIRKSATSEVIQLADSLLNAAIQVLIFGRSRRGVEMLLRQLREQRKENPQYYRSYRSGYLASERREIESGLRDGKLKAVAATNALELGVDIGGVDAVLITGYPGSVAALRQQSGRAGRRAADSLSVLVASGNPIDQYLMRHPEYLIDQSPESALIDPDHPIILLGHLKCAAFELPFSAGDQFGNLDINLLKEYLDYLASTGVLNLGGGKYFWTDTAYPANNLSLRSSDAKAISLICHDGTKSLTIGEIDYSSALWMVHPKAIYLHDGASYLITNLDIEKSEAVLQEVDVDYFTDPVRKVTIQKINEIENKEYPDILCTFGEIQVISEIVGFKKLLWTTREVLSVNELTLPSTTFRTTAYWFTLEDHVVESLRESLLWKNDVNNYGKNWDNIRSLIRHRDQFRCQVCGLLEGEKAHHVHHKTPLRSFSTLEEANHPENLITLCATCHKLAEANVKIRSGLAGLGYALSQLAPIFLMCDSSDIGVLSDSASSLSGGKPTVILYDQCIAGIGLSRKCFDLHPQVMESLKELISGCVCSDGCPSCVGPGGENGAGGKIETLAILDEISR